ncbi:hypothetical protein BJ170DRAFT_60556 [Xylariales sp. AK1849]|nr:hypothetical protein BJ170DRAFT_60556 [Xylariales sp. AK1849]
MGWMWSSPSPPKATIDDKAAATRIPAPTVVAAPTEPDSAYSDPEIAKFMAQLQAEFGGGSSSSKPTGPARSEAPATAPPSAAKPTLVASSTTAPSETKPSWSSLWSSSSSQSASDLPTPSTQTNTPQGFPDETSSSTPLDPVSESLLPTSMSCRQAFDAAFYCQSVGGQWNAVFRQGEVRSCSEPWNDFWFCMRTRAMTGRVKEEAVREYYRGKERARYGPGMPSSKDVWESREEKVPVGSAFSLPAPNPDVSDEEWYALEIVRRRTVQEALAAEAKGGQDSRV